MIPCRQHGVDKLLRRSIISSLSNMIRSQGCQISSPGAVACGQCGPMRRARHISIAAAIGSKAALTAKPTGRSRCVTSRKGAGPSSCTSPQPEPARGTNPSRRPPHPGRGGLDFRATFGRPFPARPLAGWAGSRIFQRPYSGPGGRIRISVYMPWQRPIPISTPRIPQFGEHSNPWCGGAPGLSACATTPDIASARTPMRL